MSIKFSKWTIVPAAVLLLGTLALAQDPSSSGSSSNSGSSASQGSGTPSTAPAQKPTIAQRKENQQDRIAQGVKSGQLTAGETSNLETKEAAINGETRADRAANGGKLTQAEKQQVNSQQNKLSKQIYQDKHNANTAHYGNNQVGQRRAKPAGPHSPGHQERPIDCRRNRQARKPAEGHQPASEGGSFCKRRQAHNRREEAGQQGTERRFQEHLQQEAQRATQPKVK